MTATVITYGADGTVSASPDPRRDPSCQGCVDFGICAWHATPPEERPRGRTKGPAPASRAAEPKPSPYAAEIAAKRLDPRYVEVPAGEVPPACRACGGSLLSHHQWGTLWAWAGPLGLCRNRTGCLGVHHEVFAAIAAVAVERGASLNDAARVAETWAEAAALEHGRRNPAPKSRQPKRIT